MEAGMKIKEVIVVEGKDDTVAIKRAVNADTIETNGSAVNDEVIERIRLAQQKNEVLLFFLQIQIFLENASAILFRKGYQAVSMLSYLRRRLWQSVIKVWELSMPLMKRYDVHCKV
ncbi:hypothetical protein GCM10020331_019060 [Ectobacillus funiculus]